MSNYEKLEGVCRRALPGEAKRIFEAMKPYYHESRYSKNLTLDPTTAIATFDYAFNHDMIDAFVAEADGEVAGIIITVYNPSFFVGYEGDIDFFAVLKEYRGTAIGRELVKMAVAAAELRGANVLYCGCHSGFDDGGKNVKTYENLFGKVGFEVNGSNMQLDLKG